MPDEVSPNFTPYPRAMYHRTLGCVIVDDPDAEAALGAGWYRSWQDMDRAEAAQATPQRKGRTHDRP